MKYPGDSHGDYIETFRKEFHIVSQEINETGGRVSREWTIPYKEITSFDVKVGGTDEDIIADIKLVTIAIETTENARPFTHTWGVEKSSEEHKRFSAYVDFMRIIDDEVNNNSDFAKRNTALCAYELYRGCFDQQRGKIDQQELEAFAKELLENDEFEDDSKEAKEYDFIIFKLNDDMQEIYPLGFAGNTLEPSWYEFCQTDRFLCTSRLVMFPATINEVKERYEGVLGNIWIEDCDAGTPWQTDPIATRYINKNGEKGEILALSKTRKKMIVSFFYEDFGLENEETGLMEVPCFDAYMNYYFDEYGDLLMVGYYNIFKGIRKY